MVGNLCSFVASHLGELLTFGVSLGAIVTSWMCIKRTMNVEIRKSIVLRKLDYAERALAGLSLIIEDANALLLVTNGNLSDENLEIVRQVLNQGLEKWTTKQIEMRSNLMLANLYFNFIQVIHLKDSFEKLKEIFVKSRQWGTVEVMDQESREELRKCIKEVGLIIENDLAHYQAMYLVLLEKFNKCASERIR